MGDTFDWWKEHGGWVIATFFIMLLVIAGTWYYTKNRNQDYQPTMVPTSSQGENGKRIYRDLGDPNHTYTR